MLRKTDEAHFHTPADIAGYLDTARGLLEEAGLGTADHDATLAALVNLLAQKQVTFEQVGVGAPHMAIPRGNARH